MSSVAGQSVQSGVLIGRAGSRRRLTEALQQALTGTTRVTMVTGVAGIGKTALVTSITPSLPSEAMLGWGTCWEGGAAPGYWPWTQALGALTDAIGLERARSLAADDAGLLSSIAPVLGTGGRQHAGEVDQPMLVLFDAATRWLARIAALRPAVIVLDDLHWADQSSLELFDFVSRSLHSAPVLIVGTHRPDELDPAARTLLVAVAARGDHITLEGLSASEVRSLIATLAGDDVASRRGEEIHRRTGGHPLLVRELASVGESAAADAAALSSVVQEAIARRLARADDATVSLLRAAAVVGNELQPDVLSAVLEIEPDETATAIELATRDRCGHPG